MAKPTSFPATLSLLILLLLLSVSASSAAPDDSVYATFLQCLTQHTNSSTQLSNILFSPTNSSFSSVLQNYIRNSRFNTTSTPKPSIIVTPLQESHVQGAVICAKAIGIQIKIRSGGHDYEGLSYVSDVSFIIIDLTNLRSINIDIKEETAWVQSGATLGELYYAIANASKVHGFPAGSCPTVGVGGHLSGGGFGTIFRKYGLAADNVIDAHIVDVNGKILNRTLMGEDLFWAIRGGGGASFGVITAWKVKLVRVPPIVTIFEVPRTLDQDASTLFQKWQTIADKVPDELFLHSVMGVANSSSRGGKTIQVSFTGLYLGKVDNLLPLMKNSFSELGLQHSNCTEMSWIQSVLYLAGYSINTSLDVLLQRNQTYGSFKAKSDYVKKPFPKAGLEGLWNILLEENRSSLVITPYGGRMSEISESKTPFPHRKGIIYGIQYLVYWDSNEETQKHIDWMRKLSAYMEPYVSKSPRVAYLNYRDLDIGVTRDNTTYEEAKTWGFKYFKHNFERLARVKAEVDPTNFFRHEQSIPPLH